MQPTTNAQASACVSSPQGRRRDFTDELKTIGKPVGEAMVAPVATISANNNETIGVIIAEAMERRTPLQNSVMGYTLYEHPLTHKFALVPLPDKFMDDDKLPRTAHPRAMTTRC